MNEEYIKISGQKDRLFYCHNAQIRASFFYVKRDFLRAENLDIMLYLWYN